MRVLLLCKRQYTSRDLLDDRYGRLYEIPEGLARLGHQVDGITISYRQRPDHQHVSPAGVRWQSINALPWGLPAVTRAVLERRRNNRPDVVWASSDVLQCILGYRIARFFNVPLVLDLYDNYEHFGLSRVPGLRSAFRRACRRADGLSVVSQTLAKHVRETIAPRGQLSVIGNGVNTGHFHPMDRGRCREQLGLPVNAKLIGCAGAIDASRGIETMFQAFLKLAETMPELHLVFAGPRDKTPEKYTHPRIVDLGILPWEQVPVLINSLDASIVCNLDSTFGRYCFPMKLYESLACGVPVFAAAVGDVPSLLARNDGITFPPESSDGLIHVILQWMLREEVSQSFCPPDDWDSRASATSRLLKDVVAGSSQNP